MDTKGIDLTQCINCRFRAVVDGKEVTGRIEKPKTNFFLTGDDWFGCAVTPAELDNLLRGAGLTVEDEGPYISGFEIVPRDPETYRDWQVGDIIWDSHESGDSGRIIFRSGDFVAANIGGCMCYTCEEMHGSGWRLVLTDIERQIIEEKKKYEPQDGDICYAESKNDYRSIFVFRDGVFATGFYISYGKFEKDAWKLMMSSGYAISDNDVAVLRPATEDEKQMLFDAMAKEGKRWNAEKKVVEDIPKPYEFKKGEPVLARDYDNELWALYAYHKQAGDKHIVKKCFQTVLQSQCIPYNERTMHLLGTNKDYKWEE